MAQVAEVEQFEEKKVFLGLNKMDSCGQKSTFSCNCGLYHNAYTGMGRKKFLQAQKILLHSYFLTSKCLTTAT